MITFENVTFTYPDTAHPVLSHINLNVPESEFMLFVGASGAGKSTLLRCINGLIPHFSGGTLAGQIRVNGLDPVIATPQIMSRHVGFVFQDPEAQFVMDQVEDEIAFALENAAMLPQKMRIRVEEVLDLLDLAALRERPLDTLSGGERQRVAIAAALAFRPGILVLDEPTSQLDPKSAEDVLQALVRLNSDLGLTILLAEHRLERVLPFVDQIVYLAEGGDDVLSGTPNEVLPQIELVPPMVTLARKLDWTPLPLNIKDGRRHSRSWLAERSIDLQPSRPSSPAGRPCLQASQVVVLFGQQMILRNIDLTVRSGEIVTLMGRNGAGKTTLLKSLVGLVKPQKGQISVNEQDVTQLAVADICQHVGYLPQDPNALLFADTVLDELLITLRNHNIKPEDAPLAPIELLAMLGLVDKADAYPRDLSVGERQRVALGAVLVTRPGVLLLDEPTRGLDYGAKRTLTKLLHNWRNEGKAILLVTHDVELAAETADRVVLMSQGEIIADGGSNEILANSPLFAPQVARLFPGTGWLTVEDVLQSG